MKPRPLSQLLIAPQCSQRILTNIPRASAIPSRHYSQCQNILYNSRFKTPIATYSALRLASTSTATATKSSPTKRSNKPAKPTPPPAKVSPAKPFQAQPSTPSQPQYQPPSTRNDKLNPPASTYAPDLDVPPQKEGQSKISYLWGAGKAYKNFYKAGVKNMWSTRKLAKSLRQKRSTSDKSTSDITDTILTRAEWQIVRRTKLDMLRLPAFGVILLIFGEWTPLLVKWLTPVVPEACRIPSQVETENGKLEKRRKQRLQALAQNTTSYMQQHRVVGQTQQATKPIQNLRILTLEPQKSVRELQFFKLLDASIRLDAHSRVWDFFMTPPKVLLRMGLQRKVEYLGNDDRLIERDGGWQGLGKEELRRACVERGISVVEKSEHELRKALYEWFGKVEGEK